jgi:hypothetical protein
MGVVRQDQIRLLPGSRLRFELVADGSAIVDAQANPVGRIRRVR